MLNTSQLDTEALLRIARAVERFDAASRRGEPFRLEDLLRDVSGAEQAALLRHALVVELSYRRARGESPVIEEYERRFPHDRETIRAAFAESVTHVPLPAGDSVWKPCSAFCSYV